MTKTSPFVTLMKENQEAIYLSEFSKMTTNSCLKKKRLTNHLPQENKKRTKKRRLKKNGNLDILSEDILTNIFFQFPAEFLYNKIRHVCRTWKKIIHDPSFIESHLARSKSSLIIQGFKRWDGNIIHTISLQINRGSSNKVSIVNSCDHKACPMIKASCNGLILIQRSEVLAITNPITKEMSELPKLDPEFTSRCTTSFGLAYDHSTKGYKVVCSFLDNKMQFRCAIHTIGSYSWREMKMPCDNVKNDLPLVSTGDGAFHWITAGNRKKELESNESFNSHIVSLEVSSEKFKLTRDPPDSCIQVENCSLVELGRSLSLFHRLADVEIDIWVLDDFHKETWVKKYSIRSCTIRGMTTLKHARFFASLGNGEVVMFMVMDRLYSFDLKLYSYDLKHQKWKKEGAPTKRVILDSMVFPLPVAHVNSLTTFGGTHAQTT